MTFYQSLGDFKERILKNLCIFFFLFKGLRFKVSILHSFQIDQPFNEVLDQKLIVRMGVNYDVRCLHVINDRRENIPVRKDHLR